ncbi:MAG TPA: ATP-binding protein [Blastocatellia bacterium]|nr:ATP-binding protein [Blastocatellia bacterium]
MIKTRTEIVNSSPRIIYEGETVEASYCDPMVAAYRGNPLIEALPPILSPEEAALHMAFYPPYDRGQRNAPPYQRYHEIQNALQLFSVLPTHIDLEQRISRAIRGGYLKRNPLTPEHRRHLNRSAEFLKTASHHRVRIGTMNTGFSIVGISGIGKSRAIHEILSLYPQVAIHNHYRDQDFTCVQIVWIKLDCPPNGSTRGLCLSFFQTIDSILGTKYYKNYEGRSGHQLSLHMMRAAGELGVGLLVIDEIQNLSEAASGGRNEMLNFFVSLNNGLGVPVILVGTYAAYEILTGEFRQIRRGAGQGDLIWDPMTEKDSEGKKSDWERFINDLWLYQYTKQRFKLTGGLSHALHFESQGITDIAAKMYMIAQIYAISSGKETVTEKTLQFVAKEYFRSAAKVLSALKIHDMAALFKIKDVKPIDIGEFIEEVVYASSTLAASEEVNPNQSESKQTMDSKTTPQQEQSTVSEDLNKAKRRLRDGKGTTKKKAKAPVKNNELLLAATRAKDQGVDAYDVLSEKGFIRSAKEHLE